jgi:hypothetical protein
MRRRVLQERGDRGDVEAYLAYRSLLQSGLRGTRARYSGGGGGQGRSRARRGLEVQDGLELSRRRMD